MIDIGNGPPLVLIPGLQGRWEWMRPAVDALARSFRVLSFTLAGGWGSDQRYEPRLGFDTYVAQVDRVLEEAGVESATICGVSYGSLIALRYAALRPQRTRHLVLASALPPDYEPDSRYRFYARAPRLLLPLFFVESSCRVSPELRAALPRWRDRMRVGAAQALRVLAAPASPVHMRDRMERLRGVDFRATVRQVQAPTLLLTGEPGLDRTVPVELSVRYLDALPGIQHVVLERTGHLGTVTRPREFSALVERFVAQSDRERAARSQPLAM
jgi:pimeloyl-ACP methyl ester carboxylesterase